MRSGLINRVSIRKGPSAHENDNSLQQPVWQSKDHGSDDGSSVELGVSSRGGRRKSSRYGRTQYRQILPLPFKRLSPQLLVISTAACFGILVALRTLSFAVQRTKLKPTPVSTPRALVFQQHPMIPSRRRQSVNTDLSGLDDDDVEAREVDFGGLDIRVFKEEGRSRLIYSDLRSRRGASRDRLDSSSPSRDWYDYICKSLYCGLRILLRIGMSDIEKRTDIIVCQSLTSTAQTHMTMIFNATLCKSWMTMLTRQKMYLVDEITGTCGM